MFGLLKQVLLIYLRYNTEFGFTIPDRPIMVDDIRIRGVGTAVHEVEQSIEKADGPPQKEMVNKSKYFKRKKNIYILISFIPNSISLNIWKS